MYLIINTADNESIQLILRKSKNIFFVEKISAKFRQSEKLLMSIDKLIAKNKVKSLDLNGIGVVTGPGGFTALRIGITTANTLAYSLGIRVVGIKADDFKDERELIKKIIIKIKKSDKNNVVVPEYGREANIG